MLLFDIETNGLFDTVTKVHSLCILDTLSGREYSCTDDDQSYMSINEGLKLLAEADSVGGHNVIKYDLPVLRKVCGFILPATTNVTDTLVLSRLVYSDLMEADLTMQRIRQHSGKEWISTRLYGSHSLEAWGLRLGNHKMDYGKDTHNTKKGDAWEKWSVDMQTYCEQDVRVTKDLLELLLVKEPSEKSVELEHAFATLIGKQERFGFSFDEKKAEHLYSQLILKRLDLLAALSKVFPPKWVGKGEFTPKVTRSYTTCPTTPDITVGATYSKVELEEFNPSSTKQIVARLSERYGWKPEVFTEKGTAKMDGEVLATLDFPEAALLTEYMMIEKRISQLAEGSKAWMLLVKNGKIHGAVNTNGAVTGRCTHSNPNVAQVPAVGVPYGKECRELFYAKKGWKQVGVDASGLELRCLAHYMSEWDNGAYGDILLSGDIHWSNVQAMGLTDEERDKSSKLHDLYRSGAKTFIYGFLYGAGDEKIGRIVQDIITSGDALGLSVSGMKQHFFKGKTPTECTLKRAGKELKDKFLSSLPALRSLKKKVVDTVNKDRHLIGLDGRRLPVRSAHSALNLLLQSAGAIAVKKATVLTEQYLTEQGLVWGKDWALVAHIHDELQMQTREDIAEAVGATAIKAIKDAGTYFNFAIPLDGECKIGNNWGDTH